MNFSVIGTGFPPVTRYWAVYYFDPGRDAFVGDGAWRGVNDEISFSGVEPGGYFSCFCAFYAWNISGQYNSNNFTAVDGGRYEYDIASGSVTLLEGEPNFSNLSASYAKI